jgi:molybdenum cofactor sulfurtransferase
MCCISLYKLFGEPTGLGALLVRADLAVLLKRAGGYFGGGSVANALAGEDYHVPKPSIAAALVGGTSHYRGMLSVPAGFASLDRLGGMRSVAAHTEVLAAELVRGLGRLRHGNGRPVIEVYGAWAAAAAAARGATGQQRRKSKPTTKGSGPVVAFNVRRSSGELVGYAEVVKLAALCPTPLQLRGGCCCNPGGCQSLLDLSADDVRAAAAAGKQCGDDIDMLDGRPTGVVRASLGRDSIWEDVDALLSFLEETFVCEDAAAGLGPAGAPPPGVATASAATSPVPARLAAVYVYPIKSCAAMEAPSWWMDRASGRLLFDREWALLDGVGRVMRLSAYPELALLRPRLDLSAGTLTLHFRRLTPLVLPLGGDAGGGAGDGVGDGAGAQKSDARCRASRHVNVCGADCAAREFGGEAASAWLSHALGVHCRMVRFFGGAVATNSAHGNHSGGACDGGGKPGGDVGRCPADGNNGRETCQPEECAAGREGVAFANEAPLLLLAQSAVDALNANLRAVGEAAVSARHFRPNLVIADGQSPTPLARFQLDQAQRGEWQISLSGGRVVLGVIGACERCSMVEIDPTSGAKHGSVMRALSRHHRVRSRLLFGVFCAPIAPPANAPPAPPELVELRAGGAITVARTRLTDSSTLDTLSPK